MAGSPADWAGTCYPSPDAELYFADGLSVSRAAACTIVSPNYLHFARTVAASYVAQHPDQPFFVLIVADLADLADPADPADFAPFRLGGTCTPVLLHEIGLRDVRAEAMKYDILELNTNVKPTFLKHLLTRYALDAVVYLDPDIFVYAPLDPVFEALDAGATAVLTPHMTTPVFDGCSPGEQDLLYNGTYNLGFIAIRASDEGRRLLDWWEARCLALGFSEGRTGLFVDQKWANLMPGLFAGVAISRDAGLNMAYWNLHERVLRGTEDTYVVESPVSGRVPLRFFHFSGIELVETDTAADATAAANAKDMTLSRNTDRFTLESRADLVPIFAAYRAAVRANRVPSAEALPYGWDRFSDGTAVNRLARRLFAAHATHFTRREGNSPDPFAASGAFARFARAQGLVRGKAGPQKSTWKQFDPGDRRVRAVHRMLRWALRALGPHRYELLMRYLAHITVLRHQAVFLRDPRWPAGRNEEAGK